MILEANHQPCGSLSKEHAAKWWTIVTWTVKAAKLPFKSPREVIYAGRLIWAKRKQQVVCGACHLKFLSPHLKLKEPACEQRPDMLSGGLASTIWAYSSNSSDGTKSSVRRSLNA